MRKQEKPKINNSDLQLKNNKQNKLHSNNQKEAQNKERGECKQVKKENNREKAIKSKTGAFSRIELINHQPD